VRGTQEVWGAVVASTLTTLAVFIPVLFVQQEAGQLFRDIALAISAAVGLSMIVSATIIPVAAARLLKRQNMAQASDGNTSRRESRHPLQAFADLFVGSVVGVNRWAIRGWGRSLVMVALIMFLTSAIMWALWPKVEYLPTGNRNLAIGLIFPPPGYNLDELTEMGQFVEDELQPYWDVDPESPEAEALDYPVIGDWFYVARGRQVFLGIRAYDDQKAGKLAELIQTKLNGRLPGAFLVAIQSSLFEQGLAAGRSIDIEITGPDLDKLVELGGSVMGGDPAANRPPIMVVAGQLGIGPDGKPGVIKMAQARPVPSLDLSSPEVHVTPRRVEAAEYGVSASDLGYTVNALIDGAYAADYYEGGTKIDLTIKGKDDYAQQTHDVESLPIATPTGMVVPLISVADVELESGPEQVNRRERQRAITVQVTPPLEVPLAEAIDRIEAQVVEPMRASGQLRGGYSINLSGTADKLGEAWDALYFNLFLAVGITYLLMAALFESWVYPLVIILSVPVAAVGGIVGLQMCSVYVMAQGFPPQTLDVLTMLGFVILIGTAVNNPILIVDQTLFHMRHEGYGQVDAILESVRNRIRPIFMTTTTTVFGLIPLVLMPGAGSELYRGLGAVVLGGLLASTVVSLVLVPVVLNVMMDIRNSVMRFLFGRTEAERIDDSEPAANEDARQFEAAMAIDGKHAAAESHNGAHDETVYSAEARDDERGHFDDPRSKLVR
jgi:HAE1 family hydrophobic/amphiphilic exporter-1